MVRSRRNPSTAKLRVALLTNSLSPHTLPLCEGINAGVAELRAFVSAAVDKFHGFPLPQASFPIVVQRSFNGVRLRYRTRTVEVSEQLHLPVDTLHHLLRYRPDVLVTCQFGARTLFAILYTRLRPKTRLILWAALSSHTERERSRSRTWLRRWMVRRADAAFVNGRSGADYLKSLGFKGSTATIPYTIDDALFRGNTYQPDVQERRLLYCGRVDASKGVLRFYGVLRRWCHNHPHRRVHFEMIGGGPDCDAILADPPPPNLTLSILPRLDQADLATHYHRADLFVFPSLFDEWGVVINEAMSAGLPVLGSIYSQAVTELVADQENGWLFAPDDEKNTYVGIHHALTAPTTQLEQMSLRARDTVQGISPERITARALQAIAEVSGLPADPLSPSRADLPQTSSQTVAAL